MSKNEFANLLNDDSFYSTLGCKILGTRIAKLVIHDSISLLNSSLDELSKNFVVKT